MCATASSDTFISPSCQCPSMFPSLRRNVDVPSRVHGGCTSVLDGDGCIQSVLVLGWHTLPDIKALCTVLCSFLVLAPSCQPLSNLGRGLYEAVTLPTASRAQRPSLLSPGPSIGTTLAHHHGMGRTRPRMERVCCCIMRGLCVQSRRHHRILLLCN